MGSLMGAPYLTILYGSQTGNAQDVAERISREAKLRLYRPRVLAMDAYPMQQLTTERAVVFVTATAGQGEPPDNMRRFWRLLLRKSLPPTALAGLAYAAFGLGDSGYLQYNVTAKKLDRRLAGLGASELVVRGLGDDQHPSGYEAVLDPWLLQLWPALRRLWPLPDGAQEPLLDPSALLQLGSPRYQVTLLPGPPPANGSVGNSMQQQQQPGELQQPGGGEQGGGMPGSGLTPEEQQLLQAVLAAGAFRRVAAAAAGMPAAEQASASSSGSGGGSGGASSSGSGGGSYGSWHPFMAPLRVNRRLTAPSHWQDTRHLEFDLRGSGMEAWAPGDLLAIFPRVPQAAVEQLLTRLQLPGDAWVRITPRSRAADNGASDDGAETSVETTDAGGLAVVAPLQAVLQGVLDIAGASPRRYFFQVAQRFASAEHERERLALFATPAGRDDLHRYCHRERRTVCEVLLDFPSVSIPLDWLLEACPLLQPRLFSISSSAAASGGVAAVTAAVVSYATPSQRLKRGLVSSWLAGLQPPPGAPQQQVELAQQAASKEPPRQGQQHQAGLGPQPALQQEPRQQQQSEDEQSEQQQQRSGRCSRVPVWVQSGGLRMPASPAVPLVLIGPGTGVAPFRAFLQERAAWVAAAGAAAASTPNGAGDSSSSATPIAAAAQGAPAALPPAPTPAAAAGVAPCYLFFGCRSAQDDFYYAQEWEQLQALGVLDPQQGFVTAFSQPRVTTQAQPAPSALAAAAAADQAAAAAAVTGQAVAAALTQQQPQRKVYVTHRIREHGALLWQLLAQPGHSAGSGGAADAGGAASGGRAAGAGGAVVYVSGSAKKMPADVAAALADVAQVHGGLGREAAVKWVRQLELSGRYRVEAWT